MKKVFLLICALIFSLPAFASDKPLKIVTTTTLFADLMRKIGGEHVKVDSIASPKFNIHFIQPTPSDVRKTARADLFVFTGLDLEAWADPLLEAAGNPKLFRGAERNLDMSQGITLLRVPMGNITRAMGDMHLFGNPHYGMNPENVLIMIPHAAKKLIEIDPANAAAYQKNAADFEARLKIKIEEWKTMGAAAKGINIFSYHDEIAYFADFLGFHDIEYLEPKPGIPPTPKHLAKLENLAAEKNVKLITVATYFSRRNPEKLAAKIGGKALSILQSPGATKGTEDLFAFYDYNVKVITEALK